jgi:hypothetical protein
MRQAQLAARDKAARETGQIDSWTRTRRFVERGKSVREPGQAGSWNETSMFVERDKHVRGTRQEKGLHPADFRHEIRLLSERESLESLSLEIVLRINIRESRD